MLVGLYLDEELAVSELAALLLCCESDGITEIFVEVTMDSSNRDGSEEVRVDGVGAPPIMYPYPGGEKKLVSVYALTYTTLQLYATQLKHNKTENEKKKIKEQLSYKHNSTTVKAKVPLCLNKHARMTNDSVKVQPHTR